MSVLIVGMSHRTAPVDLLEELALDQHGSDKLRAAVLDSAHVSEAVVLATCNRIEIYAEVDRFHGSVEDLTRLVVDHAESPLEQILGSLYVHYDDAAVSHLFEVVTGMDSMVVGESQILGQVREALRRGQAAETVGAALNTLFQQGLRVGKRAHSETDIDRAGQSIVSVALDDAAEVIGSVDGARVVIVGAGSVAGLAAASVRRLGAGSIVISSRTPEHASRLADRVDGRPAALADLADEIAEADLLVSCTAATGAVVGADVVASAMTARTSEEPLAIVDLALPHDVDPAVGDLPSVTLIPLKTLARSVHNGAAYADVLAVRSIVAEEVAAYTAAREAARVAPTVVALRTMATGVVAAELERLFGRLNELTDEQRDEVTQAVRRVADKLLHEPTVRVKELAGRAPDSTYAEALAELFALDPAAVDAVTRPGEGV